MILSFSLWLRLRRAAPFREGIRLWWQICTRGAVKVDFLVALNSNFGITSDVIIIQCL